MEKEEEEKEKEKEEKAKEKTEPQPRGEEKDSAMMKHDIQSKTSRNTRSGPWVHKSEGPRVHAMIKHDITNTAP